MPSNSAASRGVNSGDLSVVFMVPYRAPTNSRFYTDRYGNAQRVSAIHYISVKRLAAEEGHGIAQPGSGDAEDGARKVWLGLVA